SRPDDGRLSRRRLVFGRAGLRPPGDLRVPHRPGRARQAVALRAWCEGREQEARYPLELDAAQQVPRSHPEGGACRGGGAEPQAHAAGRTRPATRGRPQIWYQIQTKERDEARPRSGVLRTREFLMKDSYTLDPDLAALDRSYAAHESAYRKIFERCGLRFHVVQSDTGMMGGLGSHDFMAPSTAGEDEIALCAGCDYAANVELARRVPAAPVFQAGSRGEVATPNARTIAE